MSARNAVLQARPDDEPELASPDTMTSLTFWKEGKPTLHEAILAFLKNHDDMSFVQVGGFDGVSFDPLRPFIQGGRLKGLIIEPLPDPFAKLGKLYAASDSVRIANCAIHQEEGEQTMWRFKPSAIEQGVLNSHFGGTSSFCMESMLSDQGSLGRRFGENDRNLLRSLTEAVKVPCRTFASVLSEFSIETIDLLQIDTEGYDLNILKLFDFDTHRPAIVNFEHIHLDEAAIAEATQLLNRFGYRVFKQDDDTLALHDNVFVSHGASRAAYDRVLDFDGVRGNVLFCVWTGNNPLTPNRAESLLSIYKETNCPVLFLTQNNIQDWELKNAPFHPAYEYLSETHKADYLRCYFMHHFGGGYSDLKRTVRSWMPAFEMLRESPNVLGVGYKEIGPQGVAECPEPLRTELRLNYDRLLGNCAYIFRKQSVFTQRWIDAVHLLLDAKSDTLRNNPARHPMDHFNAILPDQSTSAYPLRWTELLGEIFHPLSYEFRDRLIQIDIAPKLDNYR